MIKCFSCIVLIFMLCIISCKKKSRNNTSQPNKVITYHDRFPELLVYPIDSLAFPRSAETNEVIKKVSSKDWTSGFFPGSLWYIYQLTKDSIYLEKAKKWTALIEKEKFNKKTHDMGFKVFCSFGTGYRITNDSLYKNIIIKSAKTLITRYNSKVGAIKSWDFGKDKWTFPVIIDNMMNLELLFEASEYSKDTIYKYIAYQHAKTTLKNHFRADNSSVHVVNYDTIAGSVRSKVTHQGYSNKSSWARGQTWAIYGYTMAYRYTKDSLFLVQAKKTADFFINHSNLPEDGIPYWDFNAPNIPNEPKDASAAAVIASAFIELYSFTKEQKYLNYSNKVIKQLCSPNYIIQKKPGIPFILDHSTGNWPKNDEIDSPLSYADYYFLEALLRKRKLNKSK